ncbi:MAG TPA: 3-deoxy-7-phosphoheptulonate synthase [Terriglobales bacterium]|nr:3-deoxy-7-phosphoheptulonate synthase [Terriglobales bacterium]
MQTNASEKQIQAVIDHLVALGFDVLRNTGASQTILGAVGTRVDFDLRELELLDGVRQVHRVSSPYKLAERSFRPEGTVVDLSTRVQIGGKEVVVMAGPGSVESREQIFKAAEIVSRAGAKVLRGCVFKARSSTQAFHGMGEDGLKLLREAADKFGLLVISEVTESSQMEAMMPFVDILQVGARNMQNFHLLRELGRVRKPVLLKRGVAATIDELLLSAEYILSGGNSHVILCERGIRTFDSHTMDIGAIPNAKRLSHLPIAADPSHGAGRRDRAPAMTRAAVAAGADALLIEVHPDPEKALSDGAQSLFPEQFEQVMSECRVIASAIGRTI